MSSSTPWQETVRSYGQTLGLLLALIVMHEAAHAIVYAIAGYPVEKFVLGWGSPWASVQIGPTVVGVTPWLLGAYVTPPDGVPRVAAALAILAGPMANIGLVLLHPWNPIWDIFRNIRTLGFRGAVRDSLRRLVQRIDPPVEVTYTDREGRQIFVSGASSDVRAHMRMVREAQGISEPPPPPKNPFTEESYLDHLPLIDVLRTFRNLSVWTMSLSLGIGNLIPIPPFDGAHLLFAAATAPATPSDTPDTASLAYGILSLVSVSILIVVLPVRGMVSLFRRRRRWRLQHHTNPPA